jgi:hypothetical protein
MTTISDLKLGTELQKINQGGKYGTYSNIKVSEINETKSGRLMIIYTYTFTDYDGITTNGKQKLSNAAVSKNTRLSDYMLALK